MSCFSLASWNQPGIAIDNYTWNVFKVKFLEAEKTAGPTKFKLLVVNGAVDPPRMTRKIKMAVIFGKKKQSNEREGHG